MADDPAADDPAAERLVDDGRRDALSWWERVLSGLFGISSIGGAFTLEWFKALDGAGVAVLLALGGLAVFLGIIGVVPESLAVSGSLIKLPQRAIREKQLEIEDRVALEEAPDREAVVLDELMAAKSPEEELAAARAFKRFASEGAQFNSLLEQDAAKRLTGLGLSPMRDPRFLLGSYRRSWIPDLGLTGRQGQLCLFEIKGDLAIRRAGETLRKLAWELLNLPPGTIVLLVYYGDISSVLAELARLSIPPGDRSRWLVVASAEDGSFETLARVAWDGTLSVDEHCVRV